LFRPQVTEAGKPKEQQSRNQNDRITPWDGKQEDHGEERSHPAEDLVQPETHGIAGIAKRIEQRRAVEDTGEVARSHPFARAHFSSEAGRE
jgi:hypothetical protein